MSNGITVEGAMIVILFFIAICLWALFDKSSENSTVNAFDDDEIISVTKRMEVTLPHTTWDVLADRADRYQLRRSEYVAWLLMTHLDTPVSADEDTWN